MSGKTITGRVAPGAVRRSCSPEDWRTARRLVEEYAAELGFDLCFQDFDVEIENLPSHYGPPSGAFFVAEEDGRVLGCVGLRRVSDGIGEMKRLYVIAGARRRGIGRALAEAVITEAAGMKYEKLVLDTLASMNEANALYRSLGFTEIASYRYNPLPGAKFFELRLN